jgi:probable F420-dependent oxidoreductase
VKAYANLYGGLEGVSARARSAEDRGFDGAASVEVNHDPFLPLVLAAEHTQRIGLLTSIAVAFARNPMTVAQLGHDLNAYSRGRLALGLGSQIRPHITRRFSMPWSAPAARMREFVLAMRAIWRTWYEGAPLDFRGEHYQHTLMTPVFVPGDREHGAPRVLLAAVGPRMTEIAGEVGDGLVAHAFTTPRYLREVTLPAVERGLARANRRREDFEIACPVFAISGETPSARDAQREAVRAQIAFYASTPAYRPVLELHGWEGVGEELHRLSVEGRWGEMGPRITDEMLGELAVEAGPDRLGAEIRLRFGDAIDTWIATYEPSDPGCCRRMLAGLHGEG